MPGASEPITVVLVDDEPDVRQMVRLFLETSDFVVAGEAGEGEAGLRLIGEVQPGAVILDLQMPGLDGFAALPRIRALAPATRIVVFSGHLPPGTERRAVDLGADAVVRKGSPLADLEAALRGGD